MNKPFRPKAYCAPEIIVLIPVKKFMQKPHWRLEIDNKVYLSATKQEAFDTIRRFYVNALKTDNEILAELENTLSDLLRWPHTYNYNPDKDIYTEFRDKHNWHRGDEVRYISWLYTERNMKSEFLRGNAK